MSIRMLMTTTFTTGLCLSVLTGCEQLVSKKEYFNTAFADRRGSEPVEIYAYVPPPRESLESNVVAAPRAFGPAISAEERQREAGDQTLSPRSWADYSSSVRNELEALDRQMARTAALANQKGAAGRAAIEPAVRDFNMAKQSVARSLDQLQVMPSDQWLTAQTDSALEDSRQAVREAALSAQSVRAVD